MDRRTLLAVLGAVAVIVWFATQGWWLRLGLLSVASVAAGLMAWRAGVPLFPPRDD